MLEEFGSSLFDKRDAAIIICTNGFVNPSTGLAEMVSETGSIAASHWPSLPSLEGDAIRKEGSCVHIASDFNYSPIPTTIVLFPTKPGRVYLEDYDNIIKEAIPKMRPLPKYLPGWACRSNLNIIRHSAEELVELTEKKKWDRVYLPRVGCGSGRLKWSEVRQVIGPMLDDRFVIVHQNLQKSDSTLIGLK